MELVIQRKGERERRQVIDRLVSTVGFGDGCDVMLAPSGRTERLGMFIQQGEGLGFRPLHSPSGVFLKGLEIESMVVLEENALLRILDYDLSWNQGPVGKDEEEFKPWTPQKMSVERALNASGYRAGALNAYAHQRQNPSPQEFEGVELELSENARQTVRQEKTAPIHANLTHAGSEYTGSEVTKTTERGRSSAEEDLRRKLELVRQQSSVPANWNHEIYEHTEAKPPEQKRSVPKPFLPPKSPSALKSKDVLKHFFNHLNIEVFWSAASERRATLVDGLRLALHEVLGEDENSPHFSKFEKELKSSGPLKKLMAEPEVCGIMIRDKGLMYVDRGKGFDQPELSFFNAAHAYWTVDRLLLGSGIRMDWRGGKKSFNLDAMWGGRVILPEASWQGAYVVMRKRELERINFSMDKSALLELARKVKNRENLLLVAPDRFTAKHLSYWFLKQAESLGAVLVLSQKDLSDMGDYPRRIGVRRGDEELHTWLDWSEDMDLAGILHGDSLENGFELIRRLTHQRHGWWQVIVANDAPSALERMELDLSLQKPQILLDLHRRLLRGAFAGVLTLGGKSISGRRNELSLQTPTIKKDGGWTVRSENTQDDWL
jgi:hypothetical protein